MLAEITRGHFDLSDWCLLLAIVAFVLAAVLTWLAVVPPKLAPTIGYLGLGLLTVGLFVV